MPDLVSFLRDENESVRHVLRRLLEKNGKSAIEPIVRQLELAGPRERLEIAGLLVSLGCTDARLVSALVELLRRDELRGKLVVAAAEYGQLNLRGYAPGDLLVGIGASALDPVAALLTDADAFLRTYAAWALGVWGSLGKDVSTAVPALSSRLRDKAEPWYLRAYAANALRTIPPAPESVGALVEAVGAEHVVVRRESIRALGGYGLAALPALSLLREVRDRDRARRNREVAAEALNRIQSAR